MAPPQSILLENVTRSPREPLTIHLSHEVYCAAAGDCRCKRQPASRVDYDPSTRKRTVAVQTKRFAEAITLMAPGTPGATSRPLHPAALKTEDAKVLIAAGKLRSLPVKEPVETGEARGAREKPRKLPPGKAAPSATTPASGPAGNA